MSVSGEGKGGVMGFTVMGEESLFFQMMGDAESFVWKKSYRSRGGGR